MKRKSCVQVFPPPVLPRDYRPVHYFRPVVDTSSVSPMVAQALQASRGQLSQNAPQLQSRHTLDSAQRREMLGETGLQGIYVLYIYIYLSQGRTGTSLQSHTHPVHPIHPQQILNPLTTVFFLFPKLSLLHTVQPSHKNINE